MKTHNPIKFLKLKFIIDTVRFLGERCII